MRTSLDLMAWRASIEAAPPIPRPNDLQDWAIVLTDAGEVAGARLLRDVAAIRLGFRPPAATASRAGGVMSTIGIALSEIETLGSGFTPLGVATPERHGPEDPDEAAGSGHVETAVPPPSDLPAAAAGLRAILASPTCDAGQADAAATILASLVEADRRLPGFDYRRLRDAPLAELAFAIGYVALAAFALETRDLWAAPLGSIAFLHRTAHLDPQGLGPYLTGVGRIARQSADVVDLARRAALASDGRSSIDAWMALLSRGCSELLLMEVMDDLGDAARSEPLSLILDRLLSQIGDRDLALVRRVRDAGLDNADWALAVRAQAAIVRLRPQDYHEQVILGSIQATGGDYGSAELTFRECLRQRPDDGDAAARLSAARHDTFGGFEVVRGYETPADRQETRLRRRGVMPDHVGRKGERIDAVDVR